MRRYFLLLPMLCWLATRSATQQLTAYTKLCKTLELTDLDYRTHLNATRLKQRLVELVNGCQYVNGDLIISWFGVDRVTGGRLGGDIRGMSTDFLDSVVEITGRLVVTQVNIERLELRNLRAIRGHRTRADKAAIELAQCAHPLQLVMPRLAAIDKGNVDMFSATDRNLYCHVTRTIAWSKLFQSTGQRLNYAGVTGCTQDSRLVSSCDCSGVACSSLCSGTAGCWAPDAGACQSSGRCLKRSCRTCYTSSSSKEEECCDSSCLGGCTGSTANDCFSCRIVSYNGECRESCPKEIYDTETATVIQSNEPMVQVGNICVRKCPAPFVQDSRRRYCIAECPDGELPVGGNCTVCSDRTGQPCRACESDERQFSNDLAAGFVNCSVWKLTSSFSVDGSSMTDEAWQSLASARIIYTKGPLMIKRTQSRASNLTILRRLTYVSDDLVIMQLRTTYLGLSGLKSVKSLQIADVSGLCRAWFPKSYLDSGTAKFPVVQRNLEFADDRSAECVGAVCHPLCQGGCWGPGPELCVACANATVDGVCYHDCRLANRYTSPEGDCLPCHEECGHIGGCSGPGAHHCATCRRYKQDGVCVQACSSHLEASSSGECYSASTVRLGLLAAGLALLVLLLIAAGVLSYIYYQRRVHKYDMIDLDEYLGDASNPNDMAKLMIVNDDDLLKHKEIGSGAFGTVYRGVLRSETDKGYKDLPVAIKVLRGSNPKLGQELLNEASVLARVRHPNCVRLVALCLTEEVQLVTNLMPRGSLVDFLRNRQSGISANRMLSWAQQIAEGMAYLESISIIHRDLAARNVLLKSLDEVKITDFGLARLLQNSENQLLYTSGAMPVKWLGLECFDAGVFSHKSDVWSYGVLLWEICSYGESPYKPYRISSVDDISGLLRKGVRLSQPPVCSVDFYNIMLSCWLPNPESRPDFNELTATMKDCMAMPSKYIAYGPGMGDDDAGDDQDDQDAIVHIRERVSQPSAVTSATSAVASVRQDEYTPMSEVEPDEKANLMTRTSRPATNNYVNEPVGRRQQQQQQRKSSPVQTRRAPQSAPKTPAPPPISTLPTPDETDYLEPIKSPNGNQQQRSSQQQAVPKREYENVPSRQSKTSQPVSLDEDYMVPQSSTSQSMPPPDEDYLEPRESTTMQPASQDQDYMVPRDSQQPVPLDDDYLVPTHC